MTDRSDSPSPSDQSQALPPEIPAAPPGGRRLLHERRVTCQGYLRDDGLFDLEAEIVDEKSYPFSNAWRGDVQPGDPVHRMRVRLTVDRRLVIQEAVAETLKSPFPICPGGAANFSRLAGLRIGPGWMRAVKERYGRDQGCTHILEVLYPLGTTAFQTIYPWIEQQRVASGDTSRRRMSPPIDSCWAYRRDSEVVKALFPEEAAAE